LVSMISCCYRSLVVTVNARCHRSIVTIRNDSKHNL
jgi:hypothetical protein